MGLHWVRAAMSPLLPAPILVPGLDLPSALCPAEPAQGGKETVKEPRGFFPASPQGLAVGSLAQRNR